MYVYICLPFPGWFMALFYPHWPIFIYFQNPCATPGRRLTGKNSQVSLPKLAPLLFGSAAAFRVLQERLIGRIVPDPNPWDEISKNGPFNSRSLFNWFVSFMFRTSEQETYRSHHLGIIWAYYFQSMFYVRRTPRHLRSIDGRPRHKSFSGSSRGNPGCDSSRRHGSGDQNGCYIQQTAHLNGKYIWHMILIIIES